MIFLAFCRHFLRSKLDATAQDRLPYNLNFYSLEFHSISLSVSEFIINLTRDNKKKDAWSSKLCSSDQSTLGLALAYLFQADLIIA